eukprot:TRINITY_DN417_c0_g1_i1.p1 TRINITY_DN417_c0_g1~~TRINITY_DN417_c0_g1_i1.p1  ORF type:complete len:163 (-),score=7.16 TRINITY_DN417_c0_g1_i1:184-672(-)
MLTISPGPNEYTSRASAEILFFGFLDYEIKVNMFLKGNNLLGLGLTGGTSTLNGVPLAGETSVLKEGQVHSARGSVSETLGLLDTVTVVLVALVVGGVVLGLGHFRFLLHRISSQKISTSTWNGADVEGAMAKGGKNFAQRKMVEKCRAWKGGMWPLVCNIR